MSSKRSTAKTSPTSDEWKVTDEWGMYDPAKAGMPALFARLGRPILRAAPTSSRKERRRAMRPERPSEGVGLALAEARRRAGLGAPAAEAPEHPPVGGNPARAMRLALRAQAAVNAMGTPAAAPFTPPPQPPPAPVQVPVEAVATEGADPQEPVRKKRPARKVAPVAEMRALQAETPAPAPKARARKATRPQHAAPAAEPVAPAPAPTAPVPPAPSPRRPRGPVPLAAWAHSVTDQPQPEPRRDTRGFWRGIFRMPTEVALVEYAHGAKIHRLLIEAGDDHVQDFI